MPHGNMLADVHPHAVRPSGTHDVAQDVLFTRTLPQESMQSDVLLLKANKIPRETL